MKEVNKKTTILINRINMSEMIIDIIDEQLLSFTNRAKID